LQNTFIKVYVFQFSINTFNKNKKVKTMVSLSSSEGREYIHPTSLDKSNVGWAECLNPGAQCVQTTDPYAQSGFNLHGNDMAQFTVEQLVIDELLNACKTSR
jgi:hypothetical protein